MLSIVDYDNDADEKPEEEDVLGDPIDAAAAAPKRVGLGGVQISIVKKTPPRPLTPSAEPEAAPAAAEASAAPRPSAFVIPDSPTGEIDSKLAERYQMLVAKTKEGYCVNEHIRNAKSFRNPDILEKLVKYFEVRECGTNYPASLYDPTAISAVDNYEKLEEARRRWEERQSRKQGEKVSFTSGGSFEPAAAPKAAAAPTVPKPELAAAAHAAAAAALAKPRKSKWDTSTGSDPAAKRQA